MPKLSITHVKLTKKWNVCVICTLSLIGEIFFLFHQMVENNLSNIVSQQARLVKRKGTGWKVQDWGLFPGLCSIQNSSWWWVLINEAENCIRLRQRWNPRGFVFVRTGQFIQAGHKRKRSFLLNWVSCCLWSDCLSFQRRFGLTRSLSSQCDRIEEFSLQIGQSGCTVLIEGNRPKSVFSLFGAEV